MSNEYIDWIEKSINEEHINKYEYSDFTRIQPIGCGAFGNVLRANWRTGFTYALKYFENEKTTLKEVVNEV